MKQKAVSLIKISCQVSFLIYIEMIAPPLIVYVGSGMLFFFFFSRIIYAGVGVACSLSFAHATWHVES